MIVRPLPLIVPADHQSAPVTVTSPEPFSVPVEKVPEAKVSDDSPRFAVPPLTSSVAPGAKIVVPLKLTAPFMTVRKEPPVNEPPKVAVPLEKAAPPTLTVPASVVVPPATLSSPAPVMSEPMLKLRSEEHTSELQSHSDLVCRLLLEKKNLR